MGERGDGALSGPPVGVGIDGISHRRGGGDVRQQAAWMPPLSVRITVERFISRANPA